MAQLIIIATLKAAPEKGDALAALLVEQAAEVRRLEPGCVAYRVHRCLDDPDLFVFYEAYRDEAAFEVHRGAAHLAAFRERRDRERLIAGPADVQRFRALTD